MGKWRIPPDGGHMDKPSGIYFQNMTGHEIKCRVVHIPGRTWGDAWHNRNPGGVVYRDAEGIDIPLEEMERVWEVKLPPNVF